MREPLDVPVVLIIYRRPRTTRRVFERVRSVRPEQLFVVADGPRRQRPEEAQHCREARSIVEGVDWDCQVHRNYADENMGLKQRVVSGLNWVFDEVDRAIILEDDCVPEVSFFRFCAKLLTRFENDTHVMTISGNNFQPRRRTEYSYYFSRYMHCLGWATWRRAWDRYSPDMRAWPEIRNADGLRQIFENKEAADYWREIFDRAYAGEIDSWAYVWQYSIWMYDGINLLPERNLVAHVGFGEKATHTTAPGVGGGFQSTTPVTFPLDHPPFIVRHRKADRFTQDHYYQPPLHQRVVSKVRRILSRLFEQVDG